MRTNTVGSSAALASASDSDDASDYADDEASVQELEAAEHERRVTALLEALLPQQRNEYLQQLYTTPEYSSCPWTESRIYVTPSSAAGTSRRGVDEFWPGTKASLYGGTHKAAGPRISGGALRASKRSHEQKQSTAAPGAAMAPSKSFVAGPGERRMDGYKNPKTTVNGATRPDLSAKTKKKAKKNPAKVQRSAKTRAAVAEVPNNPIERGVTMRPSGKWQAQLYFAGKSRYIGVFDSRDKALVGYEIARKILKPVNLQDMTPQLIEHFVSLARKSAFDGVFEMFINGRQPQNQDDEE